MHPHGSRVCPAACGLQGCGLRLRSSWTGPTGDGQRAADAAGGFCGVAALERHLREGEDDLRAGCAGRNPAAGGGARGGALRGFGRRPHLDGIPARCGAQLPAGGYGSGLWAAHGRDLGSRSSPGADPGDAQPGLVPPLHARGADASSRRTLGLDPGFLPANRSRVGKRAARGGRLLYDLALCRSGERRQRCGRGRREGEYDHFR